MSPPTDSAAEPSAPPAEAPPQPGPSAGPVPGRITSRNNVTTTANRLIAEYTLARFQNNTSTDLVYIKIKIPVLFATFANTLKPLVYGNFRNIGARTITDAADITFLDNVIRTVATNAIICAYAVAFNKAASLNAGSVTYFGDYNPVDSNRFPALTTLLVSSIGPLEASHLPYKCTFIPYLVNTEVTNLINQAGYNVSYYESFLQAMKRGRTISMADVDVHSRDSSPWWTLFMNNERPTTTAGITTPGQISAFNPNSFDDRNPAILLGAMVLEDTLYDLPGPIITTTIGPFACQHEPHSIADIPAPFNGPTYINPHVPAISVQFEFVTTLNHANSLVLGLFQEDDAIADLSDLPYPEKEDEQSEATTTTKKSKTSATRKRATATESKTPVKDTVENVGLYNGSGMYTATILYFDHVIAVRVPHTRRANIVTDANKSE